MGALKNSSKLRHLKWSVPLLVFVVFAIWAYSSWLNYKKINPLALIPHDAIYILESEKPMEHWKGFHKSPFWQYLKMYPGFHELNSDAEYVDSLITSNEWLVSILGDNHFIMSAHMISKNDYDFLFAFDLKSASQLKLENMLLDKILNEDEYEVTTEEYKGKNVVFIRETQSDDVLHLVQIDNYLVCSYEQNLLFASVDIEENSGFTNQTSFDECYSRVSRSGLAQLYLNYQWIDEFAQIYIKPHPYFEELEYNLAFSAFDMDLLPSSVEVKGFSTSPDSTSPYMKLLYTYGNGKLEYDQVVSRRAAYIQSIHLSDPKVFYPELLRIRNEQRNGNRLILYLQKVLDVSLEKDILPWLGDEIAIVQNAPSSKEYGATDLVVCIKMSDPSLANEKLKLINKQIRHRTPLKSKTMLYRNHWISYFELKGFMQFLLGESFSNLKRPYYVMLQNYLLLSDNPKSLAAMIEDFENNFTLENDPAFREYVSQQTEFCLFSYLNGPQIIPWLAKNGRAIDDLETSGPYISYINQLFLNFKVEGNLLDTRLKLIYSNDPENIAELPIDSLYELYTIKDDRMLDSAIFSRLVDYKEGKYLRYYEDGSLMIMSDSKEGEFNGTYLEYYRNGQLKQKGKYKKGQKRNQWEYYDPEGNLIK